jgi:hypothetical protein
VAFGVVFAVALALALFPPLYLSASGSQASVLGIPFALAYWIIDAALLGLGLWGYYALEHIRGELDDDVVETIADGPEAAQEVLR